MIYDEGDVVPRNVNKAIHHYKLAADQNDSDAQYNLGILYAKGIDIKKDIDKAIYYY